MKNLHLSLPLILLFSFFFSAFPTKGIGLWRTIQQDSLSAYVGKYEMKQGMQTIFADVSIEKGRLTAKSSYGEVLTFDHVNGDNFKLSNQSVPVKFIRDKDNKVFQISVNGIISWARVQNMISATTDKSFDPTCFLGKYQIKANGQLLKIEVSLKNGQLWATQLWDGGSSILAFVAKDKFIVSALSMPLGFIRNNGKEVTGLLLNNRDLFTKIRN